jgi:hypothetical protein
MVSMLSINIATAPKRRSIHHHGIALGTLQQNAGRSATPDEDDDVIHWFYRR